MRWAAPWFGLCFAASAFADVPAVPAARRARADLRVSADGHAIERANGAPFFWLGDTAWMLFQRLDRADTELYLRDRARKGFTVIQAVALVDDVYPGAGNAYGEPALREPDPGRLNEAYFQHVDWVVRRANELGLVVGLLPCWGHTWHPQEGDPPALFDVARARAFGLWLGRRYRDADLVWILGGDRTIASPEHVAIMRAMAEGLHEGDGGAHLRTFHPAGAHSSSEWLHDEPWLDFNMRQNGHAAEYELYGRTQDDWRREPVKPVIDGEPLYEDHPLSFQQAKYGHSTAADVRRPLYWDLFGGAFGHTYGNHAVWQFWSEPHAPLNDPLRPWREALVQPGSSQMQHARKLLQARPGARVPDDGIIVPDRVLTAVPGRGRYRFVAMRDAARSWAMVYAPLARRFTVHLDAVKAERVDAWWFDPRTGRPRTIGTFAARGERTFTPPSLGEHTDWVLVLDDAARRYPRP